MTDNYPLGAANDLRAPYNEPMEREIDVTARQVLYKEQTLWTDDEHVLNNDDLTELYHAQHRSALEIINVCEKIVKQLMADGHRHYARILLSDLLSDCEGWEETEFEVNECMYD